MNDPHDPLSALQKTIEQQPGSSVPAPDAPPADEPLGHEQEMARVRALEAESGEQAQQEASKLLQEIQQMGGGASVAEAEADQESAPDAQRSSDAPADTTIRQLGHTKI